MNLADAVGEMSVLVPSAADPDTVQQAKTGFQQMSTQHLNTLRQAISPSKISTRITSARESMKSYSDARAQGTRLLQNGVSAKAVVSDSNAFPAVTEFCTSQSQKVTSNQPSSSNFGASGTGGNTQGATTQNPSAGSDMSISSPTGGTYDPSTLRISTVAVLAADVTRFVADTVKDLSQDACKEEILGFNASLACLVVDALAVVADAVDEGIHFCDDDLTGNVIDTSYLGIKDVHDDLFTVGTSLDNHIGSANTDIDTNITSATTSINTYITNATTNIDTNITGATTNIDSNITSATNTIDTNINTKLATLTALMQTLITNLSGQVGASTAALLANLQQMMKLEMTPDGLKVINLGVLTCDGTAAHPCPTPLATCLAAGTCALNNIGPLP